MCLHFICCSRRLRPNPFCFFCIIDFPFTNSNKFERNIKNRLIDIGIVYSVDVGKSISNSSQSCNFLVTLGVTATNRNILCCQPTSK